MHSKKYETVKYYYQNNLWSKKKVHDAVIKNWITPDEYFQITGELFEE